MKKITTALFVVLGMTLGFSQESEKPQFIGENFSLEGALAIFKESKSPEEFEKLINEEGNNVNNLDLNNDGSIDYISVDAIQKNEIHVLVLSTFLNEKEKQDIATIGIEKTGTEEAILQIEGDPELYAENTIAEPFETEDIIEKSKSGPDQPKISSTRIVVNVWFWPSVRFLYAPGYVVWVSPHRWGFYPRWWKPWRPSHHSIFHSRCAPHRVYYHRTSTHRVVVAQKTYSPRRHASTLVVKNRRGTTVIHKNKKDKVKITKNRTRTRR